ncbi:TPA: hypothetical protein ACU3FO_004491 [Salmonella enterica]|nr:phage holin family protein [Salmonella enterica]HAK8439442.1 hypothetical protein [Salmonella enterica]
MPHSPPVLASFVEIYRHYRTPIDIFFIILVTATAKFLYFGGTVRRVFADVIVGTTIANIIASHMTDITISLSGVGQLTITHYDIAVVVGILGPHGIKAILSRFFKSKYGIEIPDYEFKDKKNDTTKT